MRIVGIHDGHLSTACLWQDGALAAMVSEERFTRVKNQSGFPERALRWLVSEHGLAAGAVDLVAAAGLVTPMQEFGRQAGPWYGVVSALSRVVPPAILGSRALIAPYRALKRGGAARAAHLERRLAACGLGGARVVPVEHHACHAHAAYWLDHRRSTEPTLVITLDNTGDGCCGSVSVGHGPDDLRRLVAHQSLHSVGMMYTAVTRLLGMKPVEDEYKVMGLAPYARAARAEAAADVLRRHLRLSADGLAPQSRTGLWEDAYVERLRRDFAGFRFDDVAGGVQRFLEEVVVAYVRAWVRRTGVGKLALGGGVFMNVKLNMLIHALPEVDEVFVLPSCGDEMNAAGAALACARDLHRARGKEFSPEPLGPLYLGPAFSNADVETALRAHGGRLAWRRCDDVERATADLLAAGRVVGRLSGRMEFGARALGNRSILARADSLNTVRQINAAIKMRDFWMPFAPSILWERRHDYVENPRDTPARYMILAFASTPLAARELIAGLHPADRSCRPQLVEREWNPRFHHLLRCFERRTGAGGVLNTSFNLHGEPIVCSPADAIETYLRSGLDALTLEDHLVWAPGRLDGA